MQLLALASTEKLITDIIDAKASSTQLDIWNSETDEPEYQYLQSTKLQEYEINRTISFGSLAEFRESRDQPEIPGYDIPCATTYYNALLGDLYGDNTLDPLACGCDEVEVCGEDGSGCFGEDDEDDEDPKSFPVAGGSDSSEDRELRVRDLSGYNNWSILSKRGNPRDFKLQALQNAILKSYVVGNVPGTTRTDPS